MAGMTLTWAEIDALVAQKAPQELWDKARRVLEENPDGPEAQLVDFARALRDDEFVMEIPKAVLASQLHGEAQTTVAGLDGDLASRAAVHVGDTSSTTKRGSGEPDNSGSSPSADQGVSDLPETLPFRKPSSKVNGHASAEGSEPRWSSRALAVACILMLAFGAGGTLLLNRIWPGRPEAAFVAGVTVVPVDVRGGAQGQPPSLRIENRSPLPAFVTVVGLKEARSVVYYRPGGKFVRVEPGASRLEPLRAEFGGLVDAVVVLSEAPAGEAIEAGIEESGLPADPLAARDRIAADLARFGYRGAAVELVRLAPAAR
ncbi:MAG: hypothetical protein U0797_00920 [Gemmataceae bacterium]